MKKIKLITPILGLTAITSVALPLVSCTKKDANPKDVTLEEWKNAFYKICDISQNRNFEFDADIKLYDPDQSVDESKIELKCQDKTSHIIFKDIEQEGQEKKEVVREQRFWTPYDGIDWDIHVDGDGSTEPYKYEVHPMAKSLFFAKHFPNNNVIYTLFGILSDSTWYNGSQYNSTTKEHKIYLVNDEDISLWLTLKFTDKLLTDIKGEFKMNISETETAKAEVSAQFKNYGTTDAGYAGHQTAIETEINKNYAKAELNAVEVKAGEARSITSYKPVTFKFTPATTANEFKYNQINLSKVNKTRGVCVIVDGKQWVEGFDYKVTKKSDTGCTIDLYEDVPSTSTIILMLETNENFDGVETKIKYVEEQI